MQNSDRHQTESQFFTLAYIRSIGSNKPSAWYGPVSLRGAILAGPRRGDRGIFLKEIELHAAWRSIVAVAGIVDLCRDRINALSA